MPDSHLIDRRHQTLTKSIYSFDKNGLKVADINQKGILGDCWFLSALSSLIVYDQKLIQRVLNVEYNNRNGPTRGKLKARDLEITTD